MHDILAFVVFALGVWGIERLSHVGGHRWMVCNQHGVPVVVRRYWTRSGAGRLAVRKNAMADDPDSYHVRREDRVAQEHR